MAASALVCLLLLEVVCRLFIEGALVKTLEVPREETAIVADDAVGFRLRPGDRDGMHINSFGLRGEERSQTKRPGCERILMIGGSTTFGNTVGDTETYPYQTEQILRRQSPDRCVEVINAGISGATSYHHLLRLRHQYLALGPDVVTFYVGWNDYANYIWSMDDWDPTSLSTQTLVVDVSDLQMLALRTSALYRVVYTLWRSARFERNIARIAAEEHPDQALAKVTAAFRDNLRESTALCREHGAEVVLIKFPWVIDDADPEGDIRRLSERPAESKVRRAEDLIRTFVTVRRLVFDIYDELGEEEGVSVVDCSTPFRELPFERRLELFDDPIHPNAAGYRRIADCLASHLTE